MTEHLDQAQLIDLEQPRQSQLATGSAKARQHITECPECRRSWLECQAIKTLALEASLSPDSKAVKRALQNARRINVEERLSSQAGPEAARAILLEKRGAAKGPSLAPITVAFLATLCLVALYLFNRPASQPDTAPVTKVLPFEFQEAPLSLTPTALPVATPELPAEERAEDQALDNEARRMLLAHLNKDKSVRAAATERPAEPAAPKPKPTPAPTSMPSPVATATAKPSPVPTPQLLAPQAPAGDAAVPAPPAAQEADPSTVDMSPAVGTQGPAVAPPSPQATSPAAQAAPSPAPELQAGLVLKNANFSAAKGESARFQLSLPSSGAVEIRVFDASGKSVKLLADGNYGPGAANFQFSGRNEDGEMLPAGPYYARVMTPWFSRVEVLELIP